MDDTRAFRRRALVVVAYAWFLLCPMVTVVWFRGAATDHGSIAVWFPFSIIVLAGAIWQAVLLMWQPVRATSLLGALVAAAGPLALIAWFAGIEFLLEFRTLTNLLVLLAIGAAAGVVIWLRYTPRAIAR